MPPAPGKFGRRPPTPDKPRLNFADVATAVVPSFPPSFDVTLSLDNWAMLGNDRYRDCVAVSWATERRIKTKGEQYPTLQQVEDFYRTQNPNFPADDNGMWIQQALETLVKDGGPDGVKALCFAAVDHTNREEMKAALFNFGCLWLGVNVTDANQRGFPTQCWGTSGTVEGGHSIIGTGYNATKFLMQTWASESCLTDSYVTNGSSDRSGVEEAWVVIWPEDAKDLTQEQRDALDASCTALTGKHIAWPEEPTPPEPFPAPTPEPAGPPSPASVALATALAHFLTTKAPPNYLRSVAEPWLDEVLP